MEADRTRLMLMDGDGNIRSHSSALPKEKLVCLSKLKFSHIFMRSSATVLFHGNAKQHNPSISSKLLTSLASCLPILLVIRLNIHSWGDLMSRYNSPSVMISASLPSAPVRSNLRPLQEAIIIWGKSYVSLTMLHFHYNSSHSLPANSYLLQTIRVYCSRVTCHTAPRFSKTRTALCTGTLAAKSTRKKKEKKNETALRKWVSGGLSSPCCCKAWMVTYTLWVSSVFCQLLWHRVNQMLCMKHDRCCRRR